MSKKLLGITSLFFIGSFLFTNLASAAILDIWQGAHCGSRTPIASGEGPTGPCGFCDGLTVAVNIVNDVTTLAIAITVGMTVYGAIRLMLSAGSEQAMKEAKGTITSAIIGLVIVLCGWLIVNTVLHVMSGNIDFPWATVTCP